MDKADGVSATGRSNPGSEAEFPVLYRRPRPLDTARDAGKSLGVANDYLFARETNSVPLNGMEFPQAMRSYPIVFTAEEPLSAVAILGLLDRENLFVDADGAWRADTYIPAYIRRYPFIFMLEQNGRDLTLCIDEASGLLVENGNRPLFADGKPTEIVGNALQFCGEFQAHHNAVQEFVRALSSHDLLVSNEAHVVLKTGHKMALRGFKIIDEKKFNALSDEVFLDWRRRGWLHLVYCHFMSAANWGQLVDLAAARLAR